MRKIYIFSFLVLSLLHDKSIAGGILLYNNKDKNVIYSENEDIKIYPASLVKIMTTYIALSNISDKNISLYDKTQVSYNASIQPRSKFGLKPGEMIDIKTLLFMISLKSANDSAYAIAEEIGGDIIHFVKKMNSTAEKIGMLGTSFANPSGLFHEENYTTIFDLLQLSKSMKDNFPEYMGLYSALGIFYNGKFIPNQNKFTNHYKFSDGIKTGFTTKSGYNIISSVSKYGSYDLIGIVTGEDNQNIRYNKMTKMMDAGLEKLNQSNNEPEYISTSFGHMILDLYLFSSLSLINKDTLTQDFDDVIDMAYPYFEKSINKIKSAILPVPQRMRDGV